MNVLIWGELGEDSMLQSGMELRINQNPPEFYFISVQVMRRTDSPYAPVNIIITADQYAISTCPLSS